MGKKGQNNKTKYSYEEYHKEVNGIKYKKCAYHSEYFPKENPWFEMNGIYFYKNPKNKTDGFYPECKRCSKAKFYVWIEENPERKKELDRKKIGTERKKIIDRKAAKKQRLAGKQKKWQEENRDKIYQYNLNKKLHKTHTITKTQWKACKTYFNNECAYCGIHIDKHYNMYAGKLRKEDLNKEHVDHFGSNGIENCVPSCKNCNCQKWEYQFNEWYNVNNINFTQERHDKILKWMNEDHKKYL